MTVQRRKLLLLWLYFLCIEVATGYTTKTSQVTTLRNLYDSTKGATWSYSNLNQALTSHGLAGYIGSAWFTQSQDPCSPTNFSGVGCHCDAVSQSCVITGIALPSAGLEGTLPNSLASLLDVTYLSLPHNSLVSSVPWDSLLLLTKLQVLDFHDNPISCQIPTTIHVFTSLQKLDLSRTLCSGDLPKELSLISGLKTILLNNNDFSGTIPVEWTSLVAAESIMLQKNNLFGGIPDFGALAMPNLRYLYFDSNALVGTIPASIGEGLPSLQELDLSNNMLSGAVPYSLRKLALLKRLSLSQNNLVSSVEMSFESCSNINGLNFIDPVVQRALTDINLGSNSFAGTLDQAVLALPKLEKFSAEGNCFCGTIPHSICSNKQLRMVILDGLSSGLSCRQYYFKGTAFYPAFNGFSSLQPSFGPLPDCLWQLPFINTIQASGNGLVGTIPTNISESLQRVDISHNHISGTIPPAVGRLTELILKNNRISGDLAIFGDIKGIQEKKMKIVLTNNRLSGSIPVALSTLKEGTVQILSGNYFSCDSLADLPELDPSKATYNCGSTYFNFNLQNFFLLFGGAMVCVGFVCLSRYYLVRFATVQQACRVYSDEVMLWFRVSNGSMTILLGETTADDENTEETMRSLTRYTHGLERVRLLTIYLCILVCIIYFPAYAALKGANRKQTYTYSWSTTAAFLTGLPATLVIGICFITSLLIFRQIMLHDKELAAQHLIELHKKNPNQPFLHDGRKSVFNFILPNTSDNEPWHRRVGLPMFRLFVVFLLSAGSVALANIVYLYIYFRPYHYTIKSTAAVVLALFKMIWANSGIPALIASKTLKFNLPDGVHKTFVNQLVGGEICLKFYFSLGIGVVIPLLIAGFQSSLCFYDAFLASDPTVVAINVLRCTEYDASNDCINNQSTPYSYTVGLPFVYNYTCTSSILSAYIPMYIQIYTITLAKGILRFLYLLYSVRKFRNDHIEAVEATEDVDGTNQGVSSSNPTLIEPVAILDPEEEDCNKKKRWLDNIRGYVNFGAAFTSLWLLDDQNTTGVSNGELKSTVKSFTAAYIVSRLSTVKLLWTYDERREEYMRLKPGELYETNLMDGAVGANGVLANYLGSVLILCTFGVLAPVLAVVIMCSTCVDTFVSQITLGKFLTLEASVMLLYEHYLQTNPLLSRKRVAQHLTDRDLDFGSASDDDDGYDPAKPVSLVDIVNLNTASDPNDTNAGKCVESLIATIENETANNNESDTAGTELTATSRGELMPSAATSDIQTRSRKETIEISDSETVESVFGEGAGMARMAIPPPVASSGAERRQRGGSDMGVKSPVSLKRTESNGPSAESTMRSRGGSDMSDWVPSRKGTVDFSNIETVSYRNGSVDLAAVETVCVTIDSDSNTTGTASKTLEELSMPSDATIDIKTRSRNGTMETSVSTDSKTVESVFGEGAGMARMAIPPPVASSGAERRQRGGSDMGVKSPVSLKRTESNGPSAESTMRSRGGSDMSDWVPSRKGTVDFSNIDTGLVDTSTPARKNPSKILVLSSPSSALGSVGSRGESNASLSSTETSNKDKRDRTVNVFKSESGMARIAVPSVEEGFERSRGVSMASAISNYTDSIRDRNTSNAGNEVVGLSASLPECRPRGISNLSMNSEISIRSRGASVFNTENGMARMRLASVADCRPNRNSQLSDDSFSAGQRGRAPSLLDSKYEEMSEDGVSRSRASSIASSKSNLDSVNGGKSNINASRTRGNSITEALSGMRDRLKSTFGFNSSDQLLEPVLEDDGKDDIEMSTKKPFVDTNESGESDLEQVKNSAGFLAAGAYTASSSGEAYRSLGTIAEIDVKVVGTADALFDDNQESVCNTIQPAVQEVLIDRSVYKPSVFFTLQVSNTYMESMVADANMPWGSMAAVKTVIAECSALPSSVVNLTRRIIMFVASGFLSFVINEVYNSEVLTSGDGVNSNSRIPALIMLLFLPCVEIVDYIFGQVHGPEIVSDVYVRIKKRMSLESKKKTNLDT